MKKLIIRLGILVVILVVAAVVVATMMLDSIIKKGVETLGPQVTKTDMTVTDVKISPLTGNGQITGFTLGNPEGYKSPSAIRVGRVSMSLQPKSVFSDKIIVRSIQVEAPEITLEGGLKDNNLTKILENVQAVSGGQGEQPDKPSPAGEEEDAAQTKIQVDEFILKDAKVQYAVPGLGGQTISVTLPTIELKNLGQSEEGITVAELMQMVMDELLNTTTAAVGGSSIGDAATKAIKDLTGGSKEEAGKALKGVTDLFKKKD